MRRPVVVLVGEHDFASFCRNLTRTIDGPVISQRVAVRTRWTSGSRSRSARTPSHQMVRSLVGTLVTVGTRLEPDAVERILARGDRAAALATAPPQRPHPRARHLRVRARSARRPRPIASGRLTIRSAAARRAASGTATVEPHGTPPSIDDRRYVDGYIDDCQYVRTMRLIQEIDQTCRPAVGRVASRRPRRSGWRRRCASSPSPARLRLVSLRSPRARAGNRACAT
mgnify:CR=1 FL=1